MITLKRSGSKSQGNLVWRFQDYEIQDLDIFYRIQKDNKSIVFVSSLKDAKKFLEDYTQKGEQYEN
jgi:hypothetical protein|tara:strand:+ start:279 stop:476 length:198 start_codon:yes stop_codon:yes gene_type:complete